MLPFQFTVTHAAGRTMCIADNLSRHPSPTKGNSRTIKAEELWHNGLTVNETKIRNKIVSDTDKSAADETISQPIRREQAKTSGQATRASAESNEKSSVNNI